MSVHRPFLPPLDVFIIAGQSNAVGIGAPFDATLDAPSDGVFSFYKDRTTIARAQEPTDLDGTYADRIGFGLQFGKLYYAAAGRHVLLVQCGEGSTGFSNSRWRVGDDLYLAAIARANSALGSRTGNRLGGLLWHGGETDALASWTESQYATAFDAMVVGLRAGITGASQMPVVVGGMLSAFVNGNVARAPVQAALVATPGRITKAAYADPLSPTVLTSDDGVHFKATAQRTLAGRYYSAFASIT